jgi:selenocysteine-specific elongation factor
VEQALAGQRTAINLQGIEVNDIVRGDILARPQTLPASMMLDARLDVLGTSPIAVKDLSRVHLHLGTAQVVCRIRVLGGVSVIAPGGDQLVQLRLEAPVVAAPGDRFIIRRYSPLETIGGGVILDAAPVKHAVSSTEVVERLAALGEGDAREAAALFVLESGALGLAGSTLSQRLGIDEEALLGVVEDLVETGRVHLVSEAPLRLVSPEVSDDVTERILASLERFHEANPLRGGMPKGELHEKVTGRAPSEIFEWVLERLARSEKVRVSRDLVAASSHQIRLTPEESEVAELLKQAYRDGRYQPPALAETASRSKKDLKLLERIERLLIQEGDLVRLSEGMVFHRQSLEELKDSVRRQKNKGEAIDVAFFKQLAGVTRKHAIPLLEWLDREKVTRRVGKDRIVL